MNTREYIESGMIEACVLGLASEAEYQKLQALCIQYPEIADAKKAFELAVEAQLLKNALTPPSYLKNEIYESLITRRLNIGGRKKREYQSPIRTTIWKYATAACLVLLAGAVYWATFVNRQYQKLIKNNIEIANRLNHSSHLDAIIALKNVVERPSLKWSIMVEPTNPSHCMAHIYWDSISKNTFLLLGNIPKPLSDKQFQLWGSLDNRPVSLGIFDVKKEGQLIQMKKIQRAKSFYITMEPRGGSATPTLKATYAVGQL